MKIDVRNISDQKAKELGHPDAFELLVWWMANHDKPSFRKYAKFYMNTGGFASKSMYKLDAYSHANNRPERLYMAEEEDLKNESS